MPNPLTPGERALLDAFVARTLVELGAANIGRIVVFGSRARGEGHADSDLDVAVLASPAAGADWRGAAQRALADIGADVQIGWEALAPLRALLLDPAHPGNTRERGLLRAIDTEGIVLWQRPIT
jgi:predicted nucleotidyltransferase